MVSSLPASRIKGRVERYEAQGNARVAHSPRLTKERDYMIVAPYRQRRKGLPLNPALIIGQHCTEVSRLAISFAMQQAFAIAECNFVNFISEKLLEG